jgi:hypothetical protein
MASTLRSTCLWVCPELSRIALCPAARAGISSFPVFSFYVKRTMSGSAPRRIAAAQKARGGRRYGQRKRNRLFSGFGSLLRGMRQALVFASG